jgi:sensory rhodopsin
MDPTTVTLAVGSAAFWATAIGLTATAFTRFQNNYDALLLVVITAVAATCYLAMALGLGDVVVGAGDSTHVVQTARYVDWFITTPLLLYTLVSLLTPALPSSVLLVAVIALDLYMIVTGLLAAVVADVTRWVWFALSGLALVLLAALMYGPIYRHARTGPSFRFYQVLALFLVLLWFAYPVVWVLSPAGASVISFETENILYLLLDVLAKAVFSVLVLVALLRMGQKKTSFR